MIGESPRFTAPCSEDRKKLAAGGTMFGLLYDAGVFSAAIGDIYNCQPGEIKFFSVGVAPVSGVFITRDQLRHFAKECMAVADYTGDPNKITEAIFQLPFVDD